MRESGRRGICDIGLQTNGHYVAHCAVFFHLYKKMREERAQEQLAKGDPSFSVIPS